MKLNINVDENPIQYCNNVVTNNVVTNNDIVSNNIVGGLTRYCKKVITNNHIVSKNNVNSLNFSNMSRSSINAERLASCAPRFLNGLTVYGNIGEPHIRPIPPQEYNQDIKNGIIPNEKIKQYYVTQSVRLLLSSGR
jgi:hypothetical protein